MSTESARKRLLQAGHESVATTGYGATSVETVVGEADVAKGTFFYHFGNKAGFVHALLEDFASRQMEWISSTAEVALSVGGGGVKVLERFMGSVATDISDEAILNGCLVGRASYELAACDAEIQSHVAGLYKKTIEAITALALPAVREAGVNTGEARRIAEGLVTVAQGAFVVARGTGDVKVYRRQMSRYAQDVTLQLTANDLRSSAQIHRRRRPRKK